MQLSVLFNYSFCVLMYNMYTYILMKMKDTFLIFLEPNIFIE